MDYTTQSLGFKIRKALRYMRIYGTSRTWMKIKGQFHMNRKFENYPKIDSSKVHAGRVGLIGCGGYAYSTIAYYLEKKKKHTLRACMDSDLVRAASLYDDFGLKYYTDDVSQIIDDQNIDLVFIASNHASHAEYAIDFIKAGKHVHIEKPHVVSHSQLDRLLCTMAQHPNAKVFLGFNRPRSPLFLKLKEALDLQSGPLMINWFIAGHEIPDDHWYFDDAEGGRVLGNLCHWTDLTLHLVGINNAFPCAIVPATPKNSKSDFVVSVIFADRSCVSFTFSAKGHTFEGVREVLNLHKGDLLANLTDFHRLSIDIGAKQYRYSSLFRNHGHEANIVNSLTRSEQEEAPGEDPRHIKLTALLFLAIRDAIDQNETIHLAV